MIQTTILFLENQLQQIEEAIGKLAENDSALSFALNHQLYTLTMKSTGHLHAQVSVKKLEDMIDGSFVNYKSEVIFQQPTVRINIKAPLQSKYELTKYLTACHPLTMTIDVDDNGVNITGRFPLHTTRDLGIYISRIRGNAKLETFPSAVVDVTELDLKQQFETCKSYIL